MHLVSYFNSELITEWGGETAGIMKNWAENIQEQEMTIVSFATLHSQVSLKQEWTRIKKLKISTCRLRCVQDKSFCHFLQTNLCKNADNPTDLNFYLLPDNCL